MNVFCYREMDSFLHKLDPRTKMLVMLMFFVYALMFKNAVLQAAVFVFVLGYAFMGRALDNVWRARKALFSVFVVTIIMWLLTMRGPTRIVWILSVEGLLYGIGAAFTLMIIIITGIVFISTTKVEDITLGCMKIGLPYRGAFVVSTAMRMIPTIAATGATILQAQKSRGLDTDSGNIMQKIKKYVPLMIPVIVSVIRGTSVFAMALESKGFGYSEKRVSYIVIGFKARDWVFTWLLLAFIVLAVFIKLYFKI